MPITFERIQIGATYTRPQLAAMWGYASYEAISRGVVLPANSRLIVLFITAGAGTGSRSGRYTNSLHGGVLRMDGEKAHASDNRIVNSRNNDDEIQVFFREREREPFTYQGQAYLIDAELNKTAPSRFRLALDRNLAIAISTLETEVRTHDAAGDGAEEEGGVGTSLRKTYERSPANRAAALQTHGTICKACGFDFNAIYGSDHADDYIEIHHTISVAAGPRVPNIATDLVPLCSNCHSMAHRRKGMCLNLEELQSLLLKPSPPRVTG